MAAILSDVYEEGLRLVSEALNNGLEMRLLGGLAVKHRSPSCRKEKWLREYKDIDVIVSRKSAGGVEKFFKGQGYLGDATLNAIAGDSRQLYYDTINQRQVDVFVGDFEMCHIIPVSNRLTREETTIPLAELFLTKIQIIELNQKDLQDLTVLLLDHEVGEDKDEECINGGYIAELCAGDWGLYKTISLNIAKINTIAQRELQLEEYERKILAERLGKLSGLIERQPKNMRWKLRDKVGEKVRWYKLPEEVN